MEKLIELLNEWKWKSYIFYMPDGADKVHRKETDAYWNIHVSCIKNCELISKEFDFIKWLVENDKIDREKFWNSETKSSKYSDYELSYDTPREDYTNILLMELAIQDEPIEFLVSILK